jgi:formylglycine-generating enzyme required for sulfatase activity
VPVGNPANAPDFNGLGSVNYEYYIGTYEVTNCQYTEFLNAADPAGANALSLYKASMGNGIMGGISFDAGAANGAKYSVILGHGNNPVTYVTWFDALRFANWMNNGQGDGSTESGAYQLLGGTPIPSNESSIVRTAGASWFLPNQNEWYKAAYYDSAGVYWPFPTRSHNVPASAPPPNGTFPIAMNTANYYNDDGIRGGFNDGFAVTGSPIQDFNQNYLTDVGAYTPDVGPWGTFDQGGNVSERYEDSFPDGSVGLRGGAWNTLFLDMESSTNHISQLPTIFGPEIGFRMATIVPEPSGFALVFGASLTIPLLRWRCLRPELTRS